MGLGKMSKQHAGFIPLLLKIKSAGTAVIIQLCQQFFTSIGGKTDRLVHIHGFLKVNGEKMSKARGTFVNASRYIEYLEPQLLRYYYASKLGPKIDDLDFQSEEFVGKVNSDLVGRVVNLASRSAKFIQEAGLSQNYPDDGGLLSRVALPPSSRGP